MRIGGAFPFGQGNVPVGLAGGEVWYVPPGNYYVQLGSVTLLQVFDAINQIWRNIGFPGGNMQVLSGDGFNYRLVNMSGNIAGINITNAGSGATINGIGSAVTGVSIGFGAAPANGIAASAYPIIGGKLSGLTIAAGGSGFTMPPLILIDPPPLGGIQATATCTISATGVINTVTLQNAGAGYTGTPLPNVYIVPQYLLPVQGGGPINLVPPATVIPPGNIAPLSGSLSSQPPFLPGVQWPAVVGGASITANGITGSGTLTGAVVTNYGVGYTNTTVPTIAFTGGGLAGGVAALPITSFSVISVSGAGGAGIVAGTAALSATTGTSGVYIATDGCNGVFQARPARGVSTSAAGAITLTDAGFGIQISVSAANTPIFSATGTVTTQPTYTTTAGGVFDVSLLNPAVTD